MSLLSLTSVTAFYGASQALFDVSLHLAEGEVLALMGRNGMGKSTTVKVICRLLPVRSGKVVFDGRDLARVPAHKAAQMGIGPVFEGRRCFPNLTVAENLIAAARPGTGTWSRIAGLFPAAGGTARSMRRRPVRRRTADAGNWPRADDQSEAVDP